jgi:ribonuclease HI
VKVAKKKKFYAVAVGRTRGIFTEWFGDRGAEKLVRGYAGAVFKGFATLAAAEAFLQANQGKRRTPDYGKKASKTARKPKAKANFLDPVDEGRIIIYTDGGALNNPGPGGYGVVVNNGAEKKEFSKGYRLTTNNRMELLACIVGLSQFAEQSPITLFSDSQYVINGITKGWAKRWKANGWMRTKTDPAINPDLWEKLLTLCEKHDVEFRWVKGHAGIEGNERCDTLATRAAMGSDLLVDTVYEAGLKHR